jgi:hypothetical protein
VIRLFLKLYGVLIATLASRSIGADALMDYIVAQHTSQASTSASDSAHVPPDRGALAPLAARAVAARSPSSRRDSACPRSSSGS